MKTSDEAVRAELERLTRDGILKPEDVVKAAKSPKNPLHPHFEWDDGAAAAEYRLEQARRLIRVFVVMPDAQPNSKPVRAFVSLHADRKTGGGYRTLKSVLSDRELYQQMVHDSMVELAQLRKKYERITELKPIWKAVEQVERKVEKKAA